MLAKDELGLVGLYFVAVVATVVVVVEQALAPTLWMAVGFQVTDQVVGFD